MLELFMAIVNIWMRGLVGHMVIGLGLTLTLYKPHHLIFCIFSFLPFFTLHLVFRTQLMLSNPYYFCL